jgi:hypothetical protein
LKVSASLHMERQIHLDLLVVNNHAICLLFQKLGANYRLFLGPDLMSHLLTLVHHDRVLFSEDFYFSVCGNLNVLESHIDRFQIDVFLFKENQSLALAPLLVN